jgi:hypothetical protein
MGQIDITDLLCDPDFVDPVGIVHRRARVNDLGNNEVCAAECISTIGSVQPASGKTLMRLPEEFRVVGVFSFWVKGKIVSDGKCQYPDLLQFHGQDYEVQVIFDWTNWGAGWCEGTCVRKKAAL